MKFTVDRVRFAEAASWAARAADKTKTTTPIMAGILIDAIDEGDVTLSAFDYEVSSRARVSAIVSDPGDCLVSAVLLDKLLATADGGDEVEVVTDDTSATIRCGKDIWDLALMPAYDFPSMPDPGEVVGWVDAEEFTIALKQVLGAVAKPGKALEILTGAYLDVAGDTLSVVATDRHRLAATSMAWEPAGEPLECGAIVPPRMLSDFAGGASGQVGVAFGRGHDDKVTLVSLTCDGRTSTSRVIDGQFVNWRHYFATARSTFDALHVEGQATALTVETDMLARALKKAHVIFPDKPGAPGTILLHLSSDGIRLTGGNMAEDLGRFSSEVAAAMEGVDITVKVNINFMANALSAMRTPLTSISIFGKVRPILLQPVTEEPTHQHLIQPIRET